METVCQELEKPVHEQIITVQNQLRICIQNHHMLAERKKKNPFDSELDDHLKVIQFLILNMGRAQNGLLTQFRQDIATKYDVKPSSPVVTSLMKKLLSFPEAPKDVPTYKPPPKCENKKISSWKNKPMKSLLKVNNKKNLNNVNFKAVINNCKVDTNTDKNKFINIGNKQVNTLDVTVDGSKIKIISNTKISNRTLLVQKPKKVQSVFKSKNTKIITNKKIETTDDRVNSPDSSSSDSKNKNYSSRSNSPTEGVSTRSNMPVPAPPVRRMDTRYGKKYEAKLAAKNKMKPTSNGVKKKENAETKETKRQNSKLITEKKLLKPTTIPEPLSIYDVSQECYLGFFGLVSKETCEMLKKKKTERKRRSVAGQSSMYSDYFQPLPKRTYTPRNKQPVVVPQVSTSNAVIVESNPIDDDEDEKPSKTETCVICHEDGNLEVCNLCSEMYHHKCIPQTNKGSCPSCMAQTTNIPSIVGANNSVGNASSSELIKRYSNEDNSDSPKEGSKTDRKTE